jgi:hypothetical protein
MCVAVQRFFLVAVGRALFEDNGGRPILWQLSEKKGATRAMVPGSVRALKGRLHVFGDKGVTRQLRTGDRVHARYHGNAKLAWYDATARTLNADGTWHIVYDDDGEEEDLHVWSAGRRVPAIMHLDGTYVQLQRHATASGAGGSGIRKTRPKSKKWVHHTGIELMRVDPRAPGARDKRDGLAHRIHFMYKEKEQHKHEGKVTHTEIKYVTLQDIVQDKNPKSARVQQQAFLNFLGHLFMTPPVSTNNMKHLPGTQAMEGRKAAEHKRVKRNFSVFKRSQEQEESGRRRGSPRRSRSASSRCMGALSLLTRQTINVKAFLTRLPRPSRATPCLSRAHCP